MGKLFIETVITGGEGIGFPFYQYWVFVCQMNYTHLPLTYLRLKNNFPSLHEGHIGEEAGLLLLKGSFSQFCGVTDEEWCSSRYLWVISFGRAATHSSNNGLLGQVSRATTHDSEHFQSWICRNITVFDQPVVNHLLLVVLPTQHSRHFWYGRGSHSLHSLPFFASASFLGWKALLISYLSFARL